MTVSTPDHTHAAGRHDGDEDGQARLLPEAADAHRLRGPADARDGAKKTRSPRRWATRARPTNGLRRAVEIDPGRRHRPGPRGPRLDQPADQYWPQAPDIVGPARGDAGPDARPLGPVPRPGPRAALQPRPTTRFDWRGWWDFGTGALGDMACHTANLAFMALKLGLPDQHRRRGRRRSTPRPIPPGRTITFEFPARGDMPPVKFTWYEGKQGRQAGAAAGGPARKVFNRARSCPTAARCWSARRASCSRRTTTAPSRTSLLPEQDVRTATRKPPRRCRATARATTA